MCYFPQTIFLANSHEIRLCALLISLLKDKKIYRHQKSPKVLLAARACSREPIIFPQQMAHLQATEIIKPGNVLSIRINHDAQAIKNQQTRRDVIISDRLKLQTINRVPRPVSCIRTYNKEKHTQGGKTFPVIACKRTRTSSLC
jgi:hypothetical protein